MDTITPFVVHVENRDLFALHKLAMFILRSNSIEVLNLKNRQPKIF